MARTARSRMVDRSVGMDGNEEPPRVRHPIFLRIGGRSGGRFGSFCKINQCQRHEGTLRGRERVLEDTAKTETVGRSRDTGRGRRGDIAAYGRRKKRRIEKYGRNGGKTKIVRLLGRILKLKKNERRDFWKNRRRKKHLAYRIREMGGIGREKNPFYGSEGNQSRTT